MPAWQFEGTVSYSTGKRVACATVYFGSGAEKQSNGEMFRTETDLSGRFQALLRDGPANAVRVFDGWNAKETAWLPVGAGEATLTIVLPWNEPDIANTNGQGFATSLPFIQQMITDLDRPQLQLQMFTLRHLPVEKSTGAVLDSYPQDPGLERFWSQFQEDVQAASGNPHAAKDIARRVADCLLRTGMAKRFDERIDVFRFVLQSMTSARARDERRAHVRGLLKTLSISMKRPFVPGNGAVLDLECAAATVALTLYACALLSLGRTDIALKKELLSKARLRFLAQIPGA